MNIYIYIQYISEAVFDSISRCIVQELLEGRPGSLLGDWRCRARLSEMTGPNWKDMEYTDPCSHPFKSINLLF